MEYNLSKHSVGYLSSFLDTVNEQIVDADITLPDYCPDIEKILKCTLTQKVYTKKISGGQLTVDGCSTVRILYCDSIRHHVRCFEQSVPFTANFNLKSTPEQYIVMVDTKSEYVNCRALSPRKLVVHGAFSLYAKVLCKGVNEVYSFDEDCDLQVKHKNLLISDLNAICQEQFSVSEDINVSTQPPVEAMLSYEVFSNITELKSIHNKIMLNAELTLRALYISDLDKGTIEHLSYVFPINKIFDCDGVMDDTVNVVELEIMSSDLHIRNDNLNDGSLLALDVKMCFSEIGYNNKNVSIIDDAYSTNYLVEQNRTSLNCEANHNLKNFTHIVKSTVSLDSIKISKILDFYSEGVFLTPLIADNTLTLSGKTNICILLEDSDKVPNYIERSIELDYKPEINDSFDKANLLSSKVHSISYRLIDDNTIEIRLELKMRALLCETVNESPVTFVQAKEDSKIKSDDCSLILYFAEKGESLWEIAKMYKTKESLLITENSLDCEKLDTDKMILVPTQ
ncbi:MAG: DUF3794 domain-containing protein [Ruminococcus sp.]|nr:DUF3794 domain-containing protein [Ruminococcus sp.]